MRLGALRKRNGHTKAVPHFGHLGGAPGSVKLDSDHCLLVAHQAAEIGRAVKHRAGIRHPLPDQVAFNIGP